MSRTRGILLGFLTALPLTAHPAAGASATAATLGIQQVSAFVPGGDASFDLLKTVSGAVSSDSALSSTPHVTDEGCIRIGSDIGCARLPQQSLVVLDPTLNAAVAAFAVPSGTCNGVLTATVLLVADGVAVPAPPALRPRDGNSASLSVSYRRDASSYGLLTSSCLGRAIPLAPGRGSLLESVYALGVYSVP